MSPWLERLSDHSPRLSTLSKYILSFIFNGLILFLCLHKGISLTKNPYFTSKGEESYDLTVEYFASTKSAVYPYYTFISREVIFHIIPFHPFICQNR